MMTYQQVLDWMFTQLPVFQRQGKSAYKANLDNTHALMQLLQHPHRAFKSVHVAGTNGKGSCSHMLASIFQEAGYKTGLYTSPHLKDFRERIRVNGQMVSETFVIDFVERYKEDFKSIKASFFEMTVGMAFSYFAEQEVDIAIVETGLGGRLDSTNVIHPALSVITNIAMDHTQFLGDTLPAIAAEKAGIIKASTPVVIGERQAATDTVFEQKAAAMSAPITFAQDCWEAHAQEGGYLVKNKCNNSAYTVAMPLQGLYQRYNVQTVVAAAQQLLLPQQAVEKGIRKVVENTALMGRWQQLQAHPLCIADTAHNKAGLQYVMQQLIALPFQRLHIVLGVVDDKVLHEILPLFPQNAVYYFCQAAIPRALSASILASEAAEYGLKGDVYNSVNEAYNKSLAAADTADIIFVGGSTFTVAEVL